MRIYTTRLLGRDPKLVLHGGGNTSVKTRVRDLNGETVAVLCVKGSGWEHGAETFGSVDIVVSNAGNLLRCEVTADDVAQAFLHQALALKTTASVTTVDGGNIAAALR